METFKSAVRATIYSGGDARTFEHTNANKSFYHASHWWAVLPNGANWYVEDGANFSRKASPAMLGTTARADIAFDDAHDKLWVLNYGPAITEPHLYRLGYKSSNATWVKEADVPVGSVSGLTSGNWAKNGELTLGLDPSGDPLIASVGSSRSGSIGLHVAYALSGTTFRSWSETTIDPGTTRDGGSNGDSKAVFVDYTAGTTPRIALAYSADGATNSWKIATHSDAAGSAFSGGWSTSVFATASQVSIDNHISAVSDGDTIYIAMKDSKNAVWVTKGNPGHWTAPVKAVNGGSEHDPSRPTLVLDDTDDRLFLFYQDHTGSPHDIYYKSVSSGSLIYDPHDLGTPVIAMSGKAFSNPQLPAHNVGADTGGQFYAFASSGQEIWSSAFDLDAVQPPAHAAVNEMRESINGSPSDYFLV